MVSGQYLEVNPEIFYLLSVIPLVHIVLILWTRIMLKDHLHTNHCYVEKR